MQIKSKKWRRFLRRDIFLLILGVLITVSGYYELTMGYPDEMNIHDVSKNWKLILDENRFRKIDLTIPYKYGDMGTIVLEKRLTPNILREGNLIFYSENMAVLAYFDEYEIYRFGNESRFLNTKKFYGNKWNIINIPLIAKQGDKIKLVLIPNSPLGKSRLPRIYAANDYVFSSFLIRKNQLAIAYGFLVCIFGLISMGYYFVNKRNIKLSKRIIYISFFALLSFLWFFFKNLWIQYVFFNEEILKMISFTASCLMTVPVFWTVAEIPEFRYKTAVMILIELVLLYTVSKLSLYIIVGRDVYYLSEIELVAKVIVGIVYIALLIKDYRKSRNSEVGYMILPSLIFFGVVLADLFKYWLHIDRVSSSIVEFGTVICLLIMTAEAIKEIKRAQNRSLWAEHYKSIVGLDIMTGLENQDAFIQMTSALENYEKLGVIAMDMNNLKRTNDLMGHAAGDELIIALAKIIKEVFGEEFRKFRLGGDEFTILSRGKSEEILEQMVWEFNSRIQKYNEESNRKLEIATGIALYDRRRDRSLKDLLNRADENMYLRKITMKIG